MSNISEHKPKQEGEGHTGKDSRVYFFIAWNTIGINNLLKGLSEIILFEVMKEA